jgi:hypothetical protein
MTALTVTVLIPTFNRADWLIESLSSILAQTRRPDEIIVINDGSVDDTLARLDVYREDVQVLDQDNSGKSSALNNAIAQAKGDLIWVFDDDDIAVPDALETLLGLLAADPQADFAYGRHDRFETRPNGKVVWRDTGYWCDCPPEDFLFESLLDMFAHQPGMLVRKSLYERVGAFDETLIRSQDYDMLLRLAQHGRPAPTERVLFHQRQHDLPRGTADKMISSQDRMQVWQQYDRKIIQKVYETLPLGKYLPAGSALTEPGMMRRALIRRGIVMARKNKGSAAREDFIRAAGMTRTPLTQAEISDLRKMFMLKYDLDEGLLDQGVRKLMLEVKHTSSVGAQMSCAAARAMVWRVRLAVQHGKLLFAFRLALLVLGLNSPIINHSGEAQSSLVRR